MHAQKVHVVFFGEDHLVNRGVAFGGEDGVAEVALDYALVSHFKTKNECKTKKKKL